jgi:hypothetical protein
MAAQVSTEIDEERRMTARLRVVYAMERINRLLEEPESARHRLPEETLELVVSCINAISDVVERRLQLDSRSSHVPNNELHSRARVR